MAIPHRSNRVDSGSCGGAQLAAWLFLGFNRPDESVETVENLVLDVF